MENNSSQQKKRKKLLECQKSHLEDGVIKDSYHLLELHKEQDCTKSKALSTNKTKNVKESTTKKKNKKSAIVESLQTTKKMICKDKLCTCPNGTQTIKSSQISDQESISKEKVLEPSWSCHAKEMSKKLWLPIETDFVDLHSNSLNGSFKQMESNSWFSMTRWTPQSNQNLQKTFLQSSMFSIAEPMEKENTKIQKKKILKKPQANKVRKVALKTTPEQHKTLLEWFGCYRYTYNWALSCIKNKTDEYKKCNFYWLRNRFINKENISKDKQFLLKTPKAIRAHAMKELAQSYTTNFKIKKTNPKHNFELKFKSKKDDQCLSIDKEDLKRVNITDGEFSVFPTFLKSKILMNIKRNKLPSSIDYECKLLLNRLGKITLVIVYYEPACDNQTSFKSEWCAIDPGIRTLYTLYSPTPNVAYEIAKNDVCRLYRLCLSLDKLISKSTKTKNNKRMKKAIIRMRLRIQNLVKEVHCKTVHFLVTNFRNIIIPSFDVSNMVNKTSRKIRSQSVRKMLTWSHYKLKERLLFKSKMVGVNVFIRSEEWTSKTCTNCLNINHDLGSSKKYQCSKCQLIMDRDLNGSRNIFQKNASVTPY